MKLLQGCSSNRVEMMDNNSIDQQLDSSYIFWDSGSAIGVDNTNTNIENHNSIRTWVLRGNPKTAIAGCPYCNMYNAVDKAGEAFISTLGFDLEDRWANLFLRFHICKMEIYPFK